MTDVSSAQAHADTQPASLVLYGDPPPPAFANPSAVLDGVAPQEESFTIKCICGFSDDDGNTVLCEKCNTWQHIVCYYIHMDDVPEVHECTDCSPRMVDRKRATEKQLQRRELQGIGERKGKPKQTNRNHKKRVKDPLGSTQPNGWAHNSNLDLSYNHDRKSGSPQDQPPPSKRPKTNHRSSASVSIVNDAPALAPGPRKRANSTLQNGYSPVKSPTTPDTPDELFSEQFMDLFNPEQESKRISVDSNSYTDIGVASDMADWLKDREAFAEATGGLQPGDVLQRIDQPVESIETPVIARQSEEDHAITAHGLHPRWRYITVEAPVPNDSLLGELKGLIGRKDDYCSDPNNRWHELKHPVPFVFFPPHLPIYIDLRKEGNDLRYVRRSCDPNVRMKILTHSPETGIHFCLIATRDIEAGEEVTMGWEIDSDIRRKLKEGLKNIEPWVAPVLANFGGCACNKSHGRECLLERARRPLNSHTESTPVTKSKGRKSKKAHVSPLSTGHATNSRAGSEAYVRNGVDDDQDNRSTSGSHKSTSRDITPATHFSLDGGDMKMSDRERRKIQQQERLFEQLEYDEQHKGKRGKRNSAGSNLNTPSLPSSVRRSSRPSVFEANADEQKQLGQSEPSPSGRHREHSHGVARKPSGASRVNGRVERKPKPVYVESATQTDENNGHITPPKPSSCPKARLLRRPVSFKRKLLQQAMAERIQREERMKSTVIKTEARSPALQDVASTKPLPSSPLVPQEKSSKMDLSEDAEQTAAPASAAVTPDVAVQKDTSAFPSTDVEMKDADAVADPRPPSPKVEEMPDAPTADHHQPEHRQQEQSSQPPRLSPPPAVAMNPSLPIEPSSAPEALPSKPIELQLQPASSTVAPVAASSIPLPPPGSLPGGPVTQSPGTTAPTVSPLSPAVPNVANPGPARKKLSLSDYTSRRAKLAQTQSSGTSATPPIAQSHPTSSPTLSTTSLPSQTSPPAKKSEPVALTTVAEETKTNS